MTKNYLFLTIFVLSAGLFQGCASLFSGPDITDDSNTDSTFSSQSAPQPLDFNSDDYRENHVTPAVQNHDIVLGMNTSEVISAWGRPRDVEVAGNGGGNERWIYYSGNSIRYGINPEKIIYFEDGKVVGWETPH